MENLVEDNVNNIESENKNVDGANENDLITKHRKERKELQAKIQSLKKSATKGDKKKRKEVLEEISKLEIDLEKRQAKELNDLNHSKNIHQEKNNTTNKKFENEEKLKDIGGGDGDGDNVSDGDGNQELHHKTTQSHHRISKAQRRRDRKAEEEKQKEAEILAQEELNKTGPRMIEIKTINNLLKSRGLMLHTIPSDGNCLYNAIKHQLNLTNRINYDIAYLRNETANYILKNKNNLISYMTNPDTGNILNDNEFNDYCEAIRSTSAWGGQVEIKALSHILKVPIEILQATGPPTIQGDEYKGPPLIITYHCHMYSLGEHYNSTKPLSSNQSNGENDNNDDDDNFENH